jgi:WD40 repeat protein
LLVGDHDGTVRLRDCQTAAELAAYSWGIGAVWKVTFSPDGLRAAACGQSGKVVVWDVDG